MCSVHRLLAGAPEDNAYLSPILGRIWDHPAVSAATNIVKQLFYYSRGIGQRCSLTEYARLSDPLSDPLGGIGITSHRYPEVESAPSSRHYTGDKNVLRNMHVTSA